MTPQDILTADSEQVELWVALLEGYRWSQSSERGHWEDPYGNPVNFGVPNYTTSLDAIWPVQAKTIKQVGDDDFDTALLSAMYHDHEDDRVRHFFMSDDITEWLTPAEQLQVSRADALTRARAICLCRIEELDELVKEKQ